MFFHGSISRQATLASKYEVFGWDLVWASYNILALIIDTHTRWACVIMIYENENNLLLVFFPYSTKFILHSISWVGFVGN